MRLRCLFVVGFLISIWLSAMVAAEISFYNFSGVSNPSSTHTAQWGSPAGRDIFLAGTEATSAQYTNMSLQEGSVATAGSDATNREPFWRFTFAIAEDRSSVNWIHVNFTGSENAAETATVYMYNYTGDSLAEIGTVPNANGVLSRNLTDAANFINSTSNEAIVYIEGANYDSGDVIRVDFVQLQVAYTPADTLPPLVTINQPANDTLTLPILFNVTLNEAGNACNYTLDEGVFNYTMQSNGGADFNATNVSIANGQYTVRYYCWDTSTNLNATQSRIFSVFEAVDVFSVNLSQTFQLSETPMRTGSLSKGTPQGLSFIFSQSDVGALYKQPSEQFNFGASLRRLAGLGSSPAQSIAFTSVGGRLAGLIRLPSDWFSFMLGVNRGYAAQRQATQALTFSDMTSRLAGLSIRLVQFLSFFLTGGPPTGGQSYSVDVAQSVSVSSFTARLGALFRQPLALLSLNDALIRMGHLVRVPFTLLTFFLGQDDQARAQRGTAQDVSLTSSTEDSFWGVRAAGQSLTLASVTNRLGVMVRVPFQLIAFLFSLDDRAGLSRGNSQSLTVSTSSVTLPRAVRGFSVALVLQESTARLARIWKAPLALLSFFLHEQRSYGATREVSHSFTFASATGRVIGFLKLPSDFLTLTTRGTRLGLFGRSETQIVSVQAVQGRFISLLRVPFNLISVTLRQGNLFTLVRSTQQTLGVSETIYRVTGLFRISHVPFTLQSAFIRAASLPRAFADFLSLSLDLQRTSSLTRGSSASVSLSASMSRLSAMFRYPISFLNFFVSGRNLAGEKSYLVRIAQPFTLESFTARFYGLTLLFSERTIVADFLARFVGASRSSDQLLSFTLFERSSAARTRSAGQVLNLDAFQTRLALVFRGPLGLLSLFERSSGSYGGFRSASALFTFSFGLDDRLGAQRVTSQTISFNAAVARTFGVLRLPVDFLSFLTGTSSRTGFNRVSLQQMTLTSMSGRLSALLRLPLDFLNLDERFFSTRGAQRNAGQTLSFGDRVSRFAGLLRGPSQLLSFDLIGRRSGLFSYLVDIADRFSLTALPSRIAGFARLVFSPLQFLLSLLSGMTEGSDSSDSGTGSTGGGGGGGGGTGRVTASSQNNILPGVDFNVEQFAISLHQGESTRRELVLTNRASVAKTLTLRLEGLDAYLKLGVTSVILRPGETVSIPLYVFAQNDTAASIFIGKIIVSSGSDTKEILVALDVGSSGPLFDIKSSIPTEFSSVKPGEPLIVEFSLYNLGSLGHVDVAIEYSIRNLLNEEVFSEHETLAIETQSSFIKKIVIPQDLPAGTYILYTRIVYEGATAESIASTSAWFTVSSSSRVPLAVGGLIVGLILLGSIVVIYFVHRRRTAHKHIASKPTRYWIPTTRAVPRPLPPQFLSHASLTLQNKENR